MNKADHWNVSPGGLTAHNGVVTLQADPALTQESAGRRIQAEYRTPLTAHTHLEPQAALVHVREDRVEA